MRQQMGTACAPDRESLDERATRSPLAGRVRGTKITPPPARRHGRGSCSELRSLPEQSVSPRSRRRRRNTESVHASSAMALLLESWQDRSRSARTATSHGKKPAGPAPAAFQVEFDRGAPIGILRMEDLGNCSTSARELTFLTSSDSAHGRGEKASSRRRDISRRCAFVGRARRRGCSDGNDAQLHLAPS